MYSAMLQEGKEPPILRDEDDAVRVVLLASEFSVPFRTFVAEEANRNHWLAVEDLLVLQYLLRHGEIELSTVMEICQQHEREARESVHRLDKQYRILEASGRRDSGVWRLRAEVERALTRDTSPTRSRQQQLDAAISTVLRALRERYDRGEHGLTNAELRELTHLNRDQMKYVMSKIRKEGMASSTRGAHALWTFVPSKNG
jgi:ATP-dependent DNA helicase RecG